tara:strand:+ start:385 stop:600 length:216 start_codon:yes stop_codon:yes gene_type:complete
VVALGGDHPVQQGDVARFMPIEGGACWGAASADATTRGGPLDAALSTTVALPFGDGSGTYALCLAEAGEWW